MSILRRLNAAATILVGEGSGATVAWLAADRAPELVACIVAIEPDGSPFVCANPFYLGGFQLYDVGSADHGASLWNCGHPSLI